MTLDEALAQAAEEHDVSAAWLDDLREMATTERARWRGCCGLLCSPCVLDLARVVDRAQALLAAQE